MKDVNLLTVMKDAESSMMEIAKKYELSQLETVYVLTTTINTVIANTKGEWDNEN